jgi:hypothetical protein
MNEIGFLLIRDRVGKVRLEHIIAAVSVTTLLGAVALNFWK